MTDTVHEYLAKIGRKGGKAASGAKKKRSPEHYRAMAAKRWANYQQAHKRGEVVRKILADKARKTKPTKQETK